MEKKVTKKIRKKVADGMKKTVGAVEVMRVSEAIGINADAIYAVPGDAAYLAKIIVLGEDEEIDDELVEQLQGDLSIGVTVLEECGICFDCYIYCTTAVVWLRTDGSIAQIAIVNRLDPQ